MKTWSKTVVLLYLCVLVGFCLVSLCDAHEGHSHSHSHSHSHDHSGHSHEHDHDHVETRKPERGILSSISEVIKETAPWKSAVLATLFIGTVPILFISVIPGVNEQVLKTLISFAVGGLLGDCFLHLLPHALHPHSHSGDEAHSHSHSHSEDEIHDHSSEMYVGLLVLGGMLSFFILEKIARLRAGEDGEEGHGHSHSHSHSHNHSSSSSSSSSSENSENIPSTLRQRKTSKDKQEEAKENNHKKKKDAPKEAGLKVMAILNIIADATHNFTDGMAIGASFLASPHLGVSTTIAVFFHEIPHEIGDYAILIQSGFTKKKAILFQFVTAIAALLGTVMSLSTGQSDIQAANWILPFTAGGFIYIATVDVVPELLRNTTVYQTIKEVIAMSVGVFMMYLIALWE